MISFTQKGNFEKTSAYLTRMQNINGKLAVLSKYGEIGAAALAAATPTDSGLTASSWTYEVVQRRGYFSIRWKNTHVEDGRPIAIMLQYGHGTGTGGYVQGRDFINPAIRPIFEQIKAEARKVVTG
jgi:hypothetical protein